MKTMYKTSEVDRAKEQAKAQIESIIELWQAVVKADESGDEDARDAARIAIHENPLCVEVRSDWHTPGQKDSAPAEFKILLCSGGSACQIIGELDAHNEPESARVQYQDWNTPWTDYRDITSEQDTAILEYCRTFYFDE